MVNNGQRAAAGNSIRAYVTSTTRMTDFYSVRARKLNGDVVSMSEYKGKVILIENTASL